MNLLADPKCTRTLYIGTDSAPTMAASELTKTPGYPVEKRMSARYEG